MKLALTPAVFQICALVSLSLAAALAAYALASLPQRVQGFLGMRGANRRASLDENPLWRAVEPLVRWVAERIGALIPTRVELSLDRRLVAAGDPLGLNPAEFVALTGLLTLAGSGLGAFYAETTERSSVYVILIAGMAAILPFAKLSSSAQDRLESIRRNLPSLVDLLCLSLSSGMDFPAAIRQIVDKSHQQKDPLREELCVMLRELQLGKTRRQVLELFATRCPSDSVREFVAAVVQAEEEGTPLSDVLSIQATASRQRRSTRAEELASKAGLQLMIPLVLIFICVLILIGGPLALNMMKDF